MSDKLQKLLAHAGYGSRRELETWISDGRVTVNGKRAKLGDRADSFDRILIDGKMAHVTTQQSETIKALIYHKPEGEICTRNDPKGRPTVFENLPAIPGGRWVSVGRLDINTSGLILFTNNGELANKLMHPSTGIEREYLVRIRGAASPETINTLTRDGVDIDGSNARFDSVTPADMSEEGTNHWYRVVIREGRYREVRRMWDAVGHTVSRLKRIRYGTIRLTRDIKRGKHTKIAPMQLEKLVNSADLQDLFGSQLYSARSGAAKPAARSRKKHSPHHNDKGSQSRGGGRDSRAESDSDSHSRTRADSRNELGARNKSDSRTRTSSRNESGTRNRSDSRTRPNSRNEPGSRNRSDSRNESETRSKPNSRKKTGSRTNKSRPRQTSNSPTSAPKRRRQRALGLLY